IGRKDQQVKVRGYRIELGEIEARLGGHPGVRESVVVARETDGGEKQLVGYVVMEEGGRAEELRAYLKERLPEYMVPAFVVALERLPLTANGKVDRRSLPAPEALGTESLYAGPQTLEEEALAQIWGEALEVERVGVEDNFFELGGDSILSIKVIARARESGVHFTLQQLFEHQTIRALVRNLGAGGEAPEMKVEAFGLIGAEDRERLPAGVEDAYPLTRLQAGMVFHSEYSPESGIYHDMFNYHLRARFDEGALRESLRRVMGKHAMLRTGFALDGYSQPLQLVYREVEVPLEVKDWRGLEEAEQERGLAQELEAERRRGFEWGRAPLLR